MNCKTNIIIIIDCQPFHHPLFTLRQARRQVFAAGWASNHKGGPKFLNTIMDVCSNRGAKHEMGVRVLNGGAGHHWPPAGDGPGSHK